MANPDFLRDKTLVHYFLQAASKTNTVSLGAISLIFTFVLWMLPLELDLPAKIYVSSICLVIFLFLVLINVILIIFQENKRPIPRAKLILAKESMSPEGTILVLKDASYLSQDALVSVFYLDGEGFETLIGYGYVYSFQQNGLVQVLVNSVVAEQTSIFRKLLEKNQDALNAVIIKSTVSRFAFYN